MRRYTERNEEIIQAWKNGVDPKVLAKQYKRSLGHIQKIIAPRREPPSTLPLRKMVLGDDYVAWKLEQIGKKHPRPA